MLARMDAGQEDARNGRLLHEQQDEDNESERAEEVAVLSDRVDSVAPITTRPRQNFPTRRLGTDQSTLVESEVRPQLAQK